MGANARGNAFDFMRIAAALAVLVSHSYALLGLPEPHVSYGDSLGTVAVSVFFVISGYLVAASWQRDPDLGRFMFRRALRIFPGLLVATLFVALVVGLMATSLDARSYIESAQVWRYIVSTARLQMSDRLPGVFEDNPFPAAVNGSLWSLQYEVAMYLLLAVVGLAMRRFGKAALGIACGLVVVGAMGLHSYAAVHGLTPSAIPFLWRLDPAQLGYSIDAIRFLNLAVFFFGGAVLYLFADHIPLRWEIAAGLLLLTVALPSLAWRHAAAWVAVPYACILFAQRAPGWFRRWGRFDYSYGIYIYAFPLQQLIAHWCWPAVSHAWILLMSILATTAFAAFSWFVVEKPALRFKPAAASVGAVR